MLGFLGNHGGGPSVSIMGPFFEVIDFPIYRSAISAKCLVTSAEKDPTGNWAQRRGAFLLPNRIPMYENESGEAPGTMGLVTDSPRPTTNNNGCATESIRVRNRPPRRRYTTRDSPNLLGETRGGPRVPKTAIILRFTTLHYIVMLNSKVYNFVL